MPKDSTNTASSTIPSPSCNKIEDGDFVTIPLNQPQSNVKATPVQAEHDGQERSFVKIVTQQADSASLQIEGKWESIGRGVVAYVGFENGASSALATKAARYVLNLPLLDETPPLSLINYNKSGRRADLLVVPQAKIISKLTAPNRLTYKDQCPQAKAEKLYHEFLNALKREIFSVFNKNEEEKSKLAAKLAALRRGPVAPLEFFKSGIWQGKYATYEKSGFPLTTVDGNPLSKKQTKKLKKLFDKHIKKYDAYVSHKANVEVNKPIEEPAAGRQVEEKDLPFSIVAGTFGAPQPFRHEAVSGLDAGPNTHLIFL